MRFRRFLPLLAVALSVAIAAGAVSAPTPATAAPATSEWDEVPLNLSNPSPSMTVRELERLAEQAAQRPLPPIVRSMVYTSDRPASDDVQSILAGHPNPGIRIYRDVPTAPTTTVKDLTNGVPTPQGGVILFPIPVCSRDTGTCYVVFYPRPL